MSAAARLTQKEFDYAVQKYRTWLALDRAQAPSSLRKALKEIDVKLADAAATIRNMTEGGVDVGERTGVASAWLRLNAVIPPNLPRPFEAGPSIAGALEYWAATARTALTQNAPDKTYKSAPLMVAAFLWELTFNGKECTSTARGPASCELQRIALTAGDHLTDAAAVKALKRTNPNGKGLLIVDKPTA